MPLTRMNVEQLDGARWVAELEMGGMSSAKRIPLWATSFDDLMVAIIRAHDAHFKVAGEARIERGAQPAADLARLARDDERHGASDHRKRLIASAEALGIRVDGRWSDARIADEIADARAIARPVAVRDDH